MKFGISGDIGDSEFSKLLSFSDYKGHYSDKSWFKLSWEKVEYNHISFEEIEPILSKFGIPEDTVESKFEKSRFLWVDENKFIARNISNDGFLDYARPVNHSYYELLPSEIIPSGDSYSEIVSEFKKYAEGLNKVYKEVPPDVEDWIKKMIRVRNLVTIEQDGSEVLLKTKADDVPVVKYWNKRWVDISMTQKGRKVEVMPAYTKKLVEDLRDEGYMVHDKTGFKQSIDLSSKFETNFKLRDYQVEAMNAWSKDNEGMISMPPGTGKSMIVLKAIENLQEKTLIVVPTRDLIHDWQSKFGEYTNREPATLPDEEIDSIMLTTYQYAWRHIEQLRKHFSFLVLDESHRISFEKFWLICLNFPAEKRMGTTSSPWRSDGTASILFPLMGGVVYHKSIGEFRGDKIADFNLNTARVSLTEQESKKYDSEMKKFRKKARGMPIKELARKNPRALTHLSKALRTLRDAENKYKKVEELAEGDTPTIVFAFYIEQAKRLGDLLNAKVITSDTPDEERGKIYKKFRQGKIGTVVGTPCLDEGVDFPDAVKGIIVASRGASRVQFVQRLGRLLRPKEEDARLYTVLVGNSPEEGWYYKSVIPIVNYLQ